MPLDTLYERINTALFLTAGGSRKVRAELVDAWACRAVRRCSSSVAAPAR